MYVKKDMQMIKHYFLCHSLSGKVPAFDYSVICLALFPNVIIKVYHPRVKEPIKQITFLIFQICLFYACLFLISSESQSNWALQLLTSDSASQR